MPCHKSRRKKTERVNMITESSIQYAFSKLNFEREKERKGKEKKKTIYKIYYRGDDGKIHTVVKSQYDLERTRDIHRSIITMIKL